MSFSSKSSKPAKFSIKGKQRPDSSKTNKDNDDDSGVVNEAELKYDIDDDGNVTEIKTKEDLEKERKKAYKKLKLKKQKLSKKGFEIADPINLIENVDKISYDKHINLRGTGDEDWDGIFPGKKRKNSSNEDKTKNQENNKKKKTKEYLSNEKANALSLLSAVAGSQEQWEQKQIQKTIQKHDRIQEKKDRALANKKKQQELKEASLLEAKRKLKAMKKENRE